MPLLASLSAARDTAPGSSSMHSLHSPRQGAGQQHAEAVAARGCSRPRSARTRPAAALAGGTTLVHEELAVSLVLPVETL